MGWFDGWFGPEQYGPNPAPQPPEYNFQDALRQARQQQLYSGLMSTGGTLMAAGQPMHPNQRAQILAHAAQNSGQMFDQREPMQTAMYGMQANKMQQDMERQKMFQRMLMGGAPTAAAQPGPIGGAPGALPPQGGVPGGQPAPLEMFGKLPPEARMVLLSMPPEQQAPALFSMYQKQMETGQWQPANEGGVAGQRNRFTGEFKPFNPSAQPGTWKDIGGGMQENTITGEKKPTNPTMAQVSVNPNVNMPPQETAEQKKLGEHYGDLFIKLQDAGTAASGTKAKLGIIGDALDKVYTGTGAQTVQDVKKAAQFFNIKLDDAANIGAGEAANALSREIALQLRNPSGGAGMPGAMSDADRNYLESMVPGMSQTAEGRKQLIDARMKLAQREIDVARLAREYKKSNGGKMDDGFYDKLQEFAEKNPLFPKAPSMPAGATQADIEAEIKRRGLR
jgi:hypothetical protein